MPERLVAEQKSIGERGLAGCSIHLAADAVENKELIPEETYMFEWRQAEPYAF